MRNRRIRILFTIIVFVFALLGLILPLSGNVNDISILRFFPNINLGLDIQGGVLLEYSFDVPEGVNTSEVVDNVITVLRRRMDNAGYTEAIVSEVVSGGESRVRVEIPGISDTQRAEELIGSKGKLYFAEVLEVVESTTTPEITRNRTIQINGEEIEMYSYVKDSNNPNLWYRVKNVFEFGDAPFQITGLDVTDAVASLNSQGAGFVVNLNFNNEGRQKFELATANLVNERIAIILDDEVIIAPVVRERISQGRAEISGIESMEEAQNIAVLIKSGNLPVDLVKFQERTLGPTLGRDIVTTIINAGIIGLIIVMIYMIIFYRWMGVIADIALIYNTFLLMGILSWTGAILTLPGIAGIILTFGTTVDGNIIIYERIKEELRVGRPPLTAVKFGFNKVFSTIFDANITTILAGLVLFFVTSGSIRGFAVTLIIGVLGAMFTNLVVSRLLLESTSHFLKPEKYVKGIVVEKGGTK
ncbi:preprotein translocase subunit SecD [Petrotoga sp. HWH.PT.55.6.1]|uniref:protein translocase subunit SecD n=1 Tax=unclassified Petrotoga TaxID=2620614 RepID=UPI000CA05A8B|nr:MULTISPECIES: protein translocase subunit SecD [unclassified Petrotoga]PNR93216.1 preprotein translocase subunit SecD [Petrotoga sp. HWHPT.55.6.3]RPD36672.1 preprotein translocase subunit SecD [Petrotoga sp. HWH.PT.55.6.1]